MNTEQREGGSAFVWRTRRGWIVCLARCELIMVATLTRAGGGVTERHSVAFAEKPSREESEARWRVGGRGGLTSM